MKKAKLISVAMPINNEISENSLFPGSKRILSAARKHVVVMNWLKLEQEQIKKRRRTEVCRGSWTLKANTLR